MNAMSDVSWNNVKRGYCARQIFEFNTMSCQPEYQKTRMWFGWIWRKPVLVLLWVYAHV